MFLRKYLEAKDSGCSGVEVGVLLGEEAVGAEGEGSVQLLAAQLVAGPALLQPLLRGEGG